MGMWVNEGTPTMSFVSYTINVEYLCDASYVTWEYRQYRRYHVIFVRKYKTFQNSFKYHWIINIKLLLNIFSLILCETTYI